MPEQPPLPTSAAKRFVSDLSVGERVGTTFLLTRCDVRTRQSGEPYLVLELADRTGRIPGRMWDGAEEAARRVAVGEYVHVEGAVDTWQSSPQLKVDRLRRVDPEAMDPADYLPATDQDTDALYDELLELVRGVENPHLRGLLEATFADPEVARRFRRAPGGVRLHHAYVGGLLEHTLSVVRLALQAADHYPFLDRDLLVTGACLHDLGKIWELSYDRAFDYTPEGRLVGHLLLEAEWVKGRMDSIEGFPAPLQTHLLHLLASHHGSHEHGAPVLPATPEALVLHYIDDLDSKMAAMREALAEAEAADAAVAYSPSLGRRVVRHPRDEEEP